MSSSLVASLVGVSDLESRFLLHMIATDTQERAKVAKEQWLDTLRKLGEPPSKMAKMEECEERKEELEKLLKLVVEAMAEAQHQRTLSKLCELLESGVEEGLCSARWTCDALFTSDKLSLDRPHFWSAVFALVQKLISRVDYKGVRELMKMAVDKMVAIPSRPKDSEPIRAVQKLITHIFDRDAALLPGYFIVNEILKSYPEHLHWPHWSLVPLISSFLNAFTPTAQMVSSAFKHRMRPIVEPAGKTLGVSSWRLESQGLRFVLKGSLTYDRILPYKQALLRPQRSLVKHILRQPYSKEVFMSVLSLQKPRKDASGNFGLTPTRYPMLEEILVDLFIEAFYRKPIRDDDDYNLCDDHSEGNDDDNHSESEIISGDLERRIDLRWRTLASALISFVLFPIMSFTSFVTKLHARLLSSSFSLSDQELSASRDKLFWALLQYLSGSIAKNSAEDFLPVFKLFDLYKKDEVLSVPDMGNPRCVEQVAAASIYLHLRNKAKVDHVPFFHPFPFLSKQIDFLSQLAKDDPERDSLKSNYRTALVCNAFSTANETFKAPLSSLLSSIGGNIATASACIRMPADCQMALGPTEALPMKNLDALTVHSKMSLVHGIVTFIINQGSNTINPTVLSPALVESYCRLLVFPEIESLGIKSVLQSVLLQAFKQNSLATLHTILEIFAFRLHHIQSNFRLHMLSYCQTALVASGHPGIARNPQLNVCIHTACLKLIPGLGVAELGAPKGGSAATSSQQTQPGSKVSSVILYGESEELNRVIVLTLARMIHIQALEQQSVPWVKEMLSGIMQKTPHSWPTQTLQNFPTVLQDFYKEHGETKMDERALIMSKVEDEYKIWNAMSNEQEILQHFANPNYSLFLCIIWKILLDTEDIPAKAIKVLDHIGYRHLSQHARSLCDVLVRDFSKSGGAGHVNKCIDAMNSLVWKHSIISLDNLILCMALRCNEGSEAQVCFYIIQLLLLKPGDFRKRVNDLVANFKPDHQNLVDYHTVHLEFHDKFPERFWPDRPDELNHNRDDVVTRRTVLPVYFSNVCLRFIPVFDILVHRFLELPPVTKSLETIIDHIGILYKFHDRPITYLYQTLHYYERRLRERAGLRKKLIASITGALKDVRPENWCLTPRFSEYLSSESVSWEPDPSYYFALVQRLRDAMQERGTAFPFMDWRFNEFVNEGAHALYVSCVEILGIPQEPSQVGEALLNVVLESTHLIDLESLPEWLNALGLLFSHLPEQYWHGLHAILARSVVASPLTQWASTASSSSSPFNMLDVERCPWQGSRACERVALTLACSHAVLHHAGLTQLQMLPELFREHFLPVVKSEEQLLFVFHVAGPFLQRLYSERLMRPLFDLTVQFYRLLHRVDKECKELVHIDPICDILYHVKYQFTGDSVRSDAERIIRDLSPPLQRRLSMICGMSVH